MRLLNIGDKLINLKNKLKLKNAVSIAAAVMLGVTSLAGCGFVSNPVEYMSQADNENGTVSDNTDKITDNSGNNAGGMKDNSSDAGSIVNGSDNSNGNNQTSGKRKVCIVGTYGSVSELVNTADYEDKIDIELIQENKDFDETKDLISLASKVQEICSGDADIVIVSARERFADQIRYFLTYTIDTDKSIYVVEEDNNNYKTEIADIVDNKANKVNDSAKYHFDVTGIKDMGYVGMVNDYIGNDVYTAQKIMASYESVVVVSDTADGSLSPAMTQLVKDVSGYIKVIVVNNSGSEYDYAADGLNVITAQTMTSWQARIMAMLCLTDKNITDWQEFFN